MSMLHRLNKKIMFRLSVVLSSVMALFIGTSARQDQDKLSQALDVPLFSIEKVYANDAGDCCGSSDSSIVWPDPNSEGVGVRLTAPPAPASCAGCAGCASDGDVNR